MNRNLIAMVSPSTNQERAGVERCVLGSSVPVMEDIE
jgi:hypothetical protein